MSTEERRRLMRERELYINGRYYWKMWLWVAVEVCGAVLMFYVFIHR